MDYLVKKHNCEKNCAAGYFQSAGQIRVVCTICDKLLKVIDCNIPLTEAITNHWIGKRVHNCLMEIEARYEKGKIIVDCAYCGAVIC